MALLELEFSILYFIQGLHTPFLDRFMTAVTSLGDKGWFFIVLGIILFCFKRTRKMGAAVLLSLAAGGLIGNVVLKNLVMRDRPCWIDESVRLLIQNPKDFSFPSGHTLASFETAVSIFLYNRKWGVPVIVLGVGYRTFQIISFCAFSDGCVKRNGPWNFYWMVCSQNY